MSAVAIRNGLVTILVASGKWAASQISTCDFGIAVLSSCAIVLQPNSVAVVPMEFGTPARGKRVVHEILGVLMIKDFGNATALLSQLWTGVDDLYSAINADDTLAGTACIARLTRITRPENAFITDGAGSDWAYLRFLVQAEIF